MFDPFINYLAMGSSIIKVVPKCHAESCVEFISSLFRYLNLRL